MSLTSCFCSVKHKCRLLGIISLLTGCQITFAQQQAIEDLFIPLPAGAIHLTGFFENDIQHSINNWNKGVVPYERLVNLFRGEKIQFAQGEMWGKSVRSGSMLYRYTQDPELKNIMKNTVRDMLFNQRENGSISCAPIDKQPDGKEGDIWERKYVMLALEGYYEDVEKDPKILESLIRQADCIINQVGEAPKANITDLGWSSNRVESSTILEPFMRLYNLTEKKKYLDFAEYIVKEGGAKGYNLFQQAYDNIPPSEMGGTYPKAYEMLSLFEGLVEYYRVTGDEKWKKSCLNLYNNIRTQEITIIGNGGGNRPVRADLNNGEGWNRTATEQSNPEITRMMETCVGVTWMKFCSQLFRLTGAPSTIDEIEKYIYNGLIGGMKTNGQGFSYINLLNGEKVTSRGWGKHFGELHVTCCNLNGPMGLAYIPYIAVMENKQGPVVNLYNAAVVNMQTPGKTSLKLNIDTEFPVSDKVIIYVDPEKNETFNLKLHIPKWSKSTIIKVNGKNQKNIIAGTFKDISREWKKGDKVEISFDMKCHLTDAPTIGSNPEAKYFQALIYGPIVLSRDENVDPCYDQPVRIVADKNGIVNIKQVKPVLDGTRMEFLIPTTTGEIRMCDYASVDSWEGKKICTWLPVVRK